MRFDIVKFGAAAMASLDARQILQTLVQGFDPVSGEELPAGAVVHRSEVLGALLEAIAALEAGAGRGPQLPQKMGKAWSAEEEAQLESAFRAGEAPPAIAARHGRTLAAIEARLERIGLITARERTTRNRYITRR